MMTFAQLAVERVLNSLPEGLLIALGAWLLLRLMGRQNSGTRFAVWLVALAGVVALPFLSGFRSAQDLDLVTPRVHPQIAIAAFWASAFFVLWIAIAIVALARIAVGLWQVRQIRRSCTEIPAQSIAPELQSLLAETKRPVRLLTSEKARVPAALGFRNPAIVLPAWALRELTASELQPILIHELAHLRRHDDWTNLLQKAVRAILFFHPAVWWIDARLSLEREMACDDAVLAATGNPRAYAGCLIDLLEKNCERRGWSMAQAAVARARDASVRIARILRVGPAATTRVGRAAVGVAACLSLACSGTALFVPQFVEFVPLDPNSAASSAAHISRPLIDSPELPAAAVIPANYHPAQPPVLTHKAVLHRTPPSRPMHVRQMAQAKPSAPKSPLVMASLCQYELKAQSPAAPEPMLIVVETSESYANSASMAQLRTIGAPQADHIRQLQSREDPALQIQLIQVIDPETGTPIQILHIVLVMPQQAGSNSQSI
jgi:beta-lactamase regulating signal transducer with metallopeptidase domain